jgi:hypothetical protein
MRRLFVQCLLLLVLLTLGAAPAFGAYTCTVTRDHKGYAGGGKHVIVTLTETEARDTSECEVTGLPVFGTITSYRATLTAGTGTTINPAVGTSAAFVVSTQDHVATATTTAAHVNEADHSPYYSATGTLYIRSRANNAATDHAITTTIIIVEGTP